MKLSKPTVAILVLAGITTTIAAVYFLPRYDKKPVPIISNFEQCQAAGYPILESYPARCINPNGQSFTQDIGNELEVKDLITISNPRPNQTIKSPLEIRGKARGSWFFEAQFPIKLLDRSGNIIAQSVAHAQGDWMTDNFVPFNASLDFKTKDLKGKLILEKDNPSGEAKNANQLAVPVFFK